MFRHRLAIALLSLAALPSLALAQRTAEPIWVSQAASGSSAKYGVTTKYVRLATAAIQAPLGAGEGAVLFPTIGAQEKGMIEKGAPLAVAIPACTTGNGHHVLLTARARVKHPNAARLLANFLMSPEGNAIYNMGQASVYEPGGLPKDYQNPKPGSSSRAAEFARLLGLQ